jgi:hypothetical protein
MAKTRNARLLELAADALDEGQSPLDSAFLVENDVTLDEAYDMATGIAVAMRIMLAMPRDERTQYLLALAASGRL